MPPASSKEQLRKDLAAEREQLGSAVDDLRAEVDELRRKLPLYAGAAVAAGVLVVGLRKLLSR
jgi:hypothetical protein